jgi:hypothetical protein
MRLSGAERNGAGFLSGQATQPLLPVMQALVPEDMIEKAAHIIDQYEFAARDPQSDANRRKRQDVARRKAANILKMLIERIATCQNAEDAASLQCAGHCCQSWQDPARPSQRAPRTGDGRWISIRAYSQLELEERAITMSVAAATQTLREAMRETVRRYSTWYLIQGVLVVIAGIVAFELPFGVVSGPGASSRLDFDYRSRYQSDSNHTVSTAGQAVRRRLTGGRRDHCSAK